MIVFKITFCVIVCTKILNVKKKQKLVSSINTTSRKSYKIDTANEI